MFRAIIALTAACLALHDASADGHSTEIDIASKSSDLGELGTLIHAVKIQFKAVIEEIFLHVLEYLKTMFHHLKLKFLKKLGKWTLSDVFHSVFDGVTDFVIESSHSDDTFESAPVAPLPAPAPVPVIARPNSYYYRRNPYVYSH